MVQNNKMIPKILIVDDVDTNRFVLRDIITEMGYQPILAENGIQALKVVGIMWPQLIISDVAMPEMDGYEFCQIMKKDPKTRDIPIIFISAYDESEDVVKGFEVGGEDYITKPFLPEVVKARVGLHLKVYESNREVSEANRLLQASLQEQLHRLEMEKRNVLYALTRVARENAAYDEEHMERLCYNCRLLAEAMQLSPQFGHLISDAYIDMIEVAAPLCDLGNVAIPASVLQKTDDLTEEEMAKIKTHTTVGGQILNDVQEYGGSNDFLRLSYEIAIGHHEYWDGSGYPAGISGNDIPLAAQIVSVASAYCALTERRVYRESYDREEALALMTEASGTKYNPHIIDILRMIARRMR